MRKITGRMLVFIDHFSKLGIDVCNIIADFYNQLEYAYWKDFAVRDCVLEAVLRPSFSSLHLKVYRWIASYNHYALQPSQRVLLLHDPKKRYKIIPIQFWPVDPFRHLDNLGYPFNVHELVIIENRCHLIVTLANDDIYAVVCLLYTDTREFHIKVFKVNCNKIHPDFIELYKASNMYN